MSTKLIRKNVRMSAELAQWVEVEAEKRGTSQSSLIVNIVYEYARQDKAMITLDQLKGMVNKPTE